MKRRRNLLVALLLVCAMGIGVGYAEFTQQLKITGTATVSAIENQVIIQSITKKSGGDGIDTTGDITPGKTVTVGVTGFEKVEDTITLNVVVKNPHDFKVKLTTPNLTDDDKKNANNKDLFEYSHDLADNTEVAAGGTCEFTITITCKATVFEDTNATFTLTFNADGTTGA